MKTRTVLLALAVCFVGIAVASADDGIVGTWKLNETKSTFTSGAAKNLTVVYEAAGDNMKVIVDGTEGDGKPSHTEWTGKFDGKDYAVTGDPNSDTRSYTKIDDRTIGLNAKKNGRPTTSGRIVVSPDGKSRTVTMTGTDSKGKEVKSISVYDKQ